MARYKLDSYMHATLPYMHTQMMTLSLIHKIDASLYSYVYSQVAR